MKLLKFKLLVAALIVFAASSAFASLTYNETVNTSSISGDTGYLYFDFVNPYGGQPGTATVSNFVTDGTLGLVDTTDTLNPASGTLSPGPLVFVNGPTVNGLAGTDYEQAITFGNSLSFQLVFNGLAVTAPTVKTSSFSLFLSSDGPGASPLLTSNGEVVEQDTPTPIPAAAWLLGSGLMGLVGLRRKIMK